MSIESSTETGSTSSTIAATRVSSYLAYLPAIFQQNADSQGVSLMGRLLLAFEKILSGLGDPKQAGVEEQLDRLHAYFDPLAAQQEFLPWLASWVALTLREDWDEAERRRFIQSAVATYARRGTAKGLAKILEEYTGMAVSIYESRFPLRVGLTSTVGHDTIIGGGQVPHYFRVVVFRYEREGLDWERRKQIVKAIIDQEKPAHTYYDLEIETPTIRIGRYSTVGKDTLLGTPGLTEADESLDN